MNKYGLTLNVTETFRRKIDAYARRHKVSRAEAIRRLVQVGLDAEKRKD